jgi:hypothetical protein
MRTARLLLLLLLGAPAAGSSLSTPADPPAGPGATAPSLARDGGAVMLTWLEPADPARRGKGETWRLRWSRFVDGAWSAPRTIVERRDFFANWIDVPSAARAADGALFAHWLQRSGADPYAYDAVVARSTDGGATWMPLGRLHDDGTKSEHGFVSLVPEGAGVRAFWLDGREMGASREGAGDHGSMTLRTALVATSVGTGSVLDERTCECCPTSAVPPAAGPLVVYRDRGADEVRDISIVRRAEDGWSRPRAVSEDGWLIAGCPVNGPAADARGPLVAVAWFTGAAARGAVRVAFSTDHGATFSRGVTVDDTDPIGRVGLRLDESGALVLWLDTADAGGAIRLRRVAPDGRMGDPLTVAASTTGRVGGPRLGLVGDAVLVIWSEQGPAARLRGVTLPARAIPSVSATASESSLACAPGFRDAGASPTFARRRVPACARSG